MDLKRFGECPQFVEASNKLIDKDDFCVERLFSCDELYVLRVSRKLNDEVLHVYYLRFSDVKSMFCAIDLFSILLA